MSENAVLESEKAEPARRKSRPKRQFNDAERAAALVSLRANHGNLTRTAQETGIDRHTLRYWRDARLSAPKQTALQELTPAAERALDQKLHGISHRMADALAERPLTDESIRDIAVTMGIAIQRRLELTGAPTSIVEHRHTCPALERYTPEQLRAILDRMTCPTVDAVAISASSSAPADSARLSLSPPVLTTARTDERTAPEPVTSDGAPRQPARPVQPDPVTGLSLPDAPPRTAAQDLAGR